MLLRKFTSFRWNSISSVELIKNVFNNFQDAIKHITEHRRKDHPTFEIKDEYDVQDLSYLILRSIFQELEFEKPHLVRQLKIDYNDYAAWNGLRDLIVFVYDPFNKTTNKNNFYSLEGQQIIRGVSFNVHIIVSN